MRYKLTDEQMNLIIPIIRRLEGAHILAATLSEALGKDKHTLWEIVYSTYPELRGKAAAVDEHRKEVIIQEQSNILTPGGNIRPFPGGKK